MAQNLPLQKGCAAHGGRGHDGGATGIKNPKRNDGNIGKEGATGELLTCFGQQTGAARTEMKGERKNMTRFIGRAGAGTGTEGAGVASADHTAYHGKRQTMHGAVPKVGAGKKTHPTMTVG